MAFVAAALVGASVAAPRPALALFGVGDVVFDPQAQAKNVAKVLAMTRELEQMNRQLQQLQRQIEDLGETLSDPGGDAFDKAKTATDGLTRLGETLARWTNELPATVEPGEIGIDELPERNAEINRYLRDRLARAELSLAGVEADRRRVSGEVAAVVTASNDAPGGKAAQQATNQLHAVVAAEQAKLEALRAMRARLAADARGAEQAEEAAADALRRGEQQGMRQAAQQLRDEDAGPAGDGK